MSLRAGLVLRQNIDALLHARKQSRKDLAFHCRRTESWISQIFTKQDRGIPLKYLDRIADFFRLETYQLFQPGLIPETDRRSGKNRRSGGDRRFIAPADVLEEPPSVASLTDRMRAMSPREYRQFARRVEAALRLAAPPGTGAAPPDLMDPNAVPPAQRASRFRHIQKTPPK